MPGRGALLIAAASLLTACGGGHRTGTDLDAGLRGPPDAWLVFDAAMIAHDAGHDAASGDAGSVDATMMAVDLGHDAGPVGGDCVLYIPVGSFGPLTPACLPRCSAANSAAFAACATASCRDGVAMSDTTPGLSYFVGSEHITTPMNCFACTSYQEMHCYHLVCTSQVESYADRCIASVDPSGCDDALANLNVCLSALTTTQRATLHTCFASHDGPAGCFP